MSILLERHLQPEMIDEILWFQMDVILKVFKLEEQSETYLSIHQLVQQKMPSFARAAASYPKVKAAFLSHTFWAHLGTVCMLLGCQQSGMVFYQKKLIMHRSFHVPASLPLHQGHIQVGLSNITNLLKQELAAGRSDSSSNQLVKNNLSKSRYHVYIIYISIISSYRMFFYPVMLLLNQLFEHLIDAKVSDLMPVGPVALYH